MVAQMWQAHVGGFGYTKGQTDTGWPKAPTMKHIASLPPGIQRRFSAGRIPQGLRGSLPGASQGPDLTLECAGEPRDLRVRREGVRSSTASPPGPAPPGHLAPPDQPLTHQAASRYPGTTSIYEALAATRAPRGPICRAPGQFSAWPQGASC